MAERYLEMRFIIWLQYIYATANTTTTAISRSSVLSPPLYRGRLICRYNYVLLASLSILFLNSILCQFYDEHYQYTSNSQKIEPILEAFDDWVENMPPLSYSIPHHHTVRNLLRIRISKIISPKKWRAPNLLNQMSRIIIKIDLSVFD